ncbi:MAG: AAA family ATPase [Bacteroidetes bacterium]|nr:AAA family ATPase [Bacteroidota bacterium]
MRITKFQVLANDQENKGIHPVVFTDKPLGHIVALAGPNGSGKSRVLDLVKTYPIKVAIRPNFTQLVAGVPELLNSVATNNASALNTIRRYIKQIDLKNFLVPNNDLNYNDILNDLSKRAANEFNQLNIHSTVQYVKKLTMDITSNKVVSFLNKNVSQKETTSEKSLERLNFFLQNFLGKEFTYEAKASNGAWDTDVKFGSREFKFDELSPGQKILYRYAMLFYTYEITQNVDISNCILILDEPEMHLHPSLQIRLIDALSDLIKDKGQLWIATHSIHILSHLSYECVFQVKNDQVFAPSRKSHGQLYKELMEAEKYMEETRSYVNSVNDWHYASFIRECFDNPNVVSSTNPKDEQYKLLQQIITKTEKITLLDFGAGTGRIGHTLLEDEKLKNKVEYHAYEVDKDNFDNLLNSGLTNKVYNNLNEIPENTFDLIVLCNVLHEIDPYEWGENFIEIRRALKTDGLLLVMEDLELVRGENAHKYGYIILDIPQLATLLKSKTTLELKTTNQKNDYDKRLFLVGFTKENIKPNNESLINAIDELNASVLSKIEALREKETIDEIDARRYAHYSQLYINSTLFLKNYKTPTITS